MLSFFKYSIVHILRFQAKLVLRKYHPRIIAVTGNLGKTSAKDAIYAALAEGHHVRASEKSFNSEIGVPLTILGLPNGASNPLRWLENIIDGFLLLLVKVDYPEWLVLEVGADRPGDIKSVASWLKTDVVVMTRLPEVPVHVEYFPSPEALWEEKVSLITSLKKGGTLVLFNDNNVLERVLPKVEAQGAKVITYGVAEGSDVRAEGYELVWRKGESDGEGSEYHWPIGMSTRLILGEESVPFMLLGAVGPHMLLSILAAAAVARALEVDVLLSLRALQHFAPPPGRMHLIAGVKNTLIIDDTYNSSPAATTAALNTLAFVCNKREGATEGSQEYKKGRSIAVLGDMLELGRHSVEAHRAIGTHVASTADLLMTVGFRSRDTAEGALDAGLAESAVLQFEDARSAGLELQNLLREGDCVLVKGSQSMRMERVVEEIMAVPEKASELLVRQDKDWKKR